MAHQGKGISERSTKTLRTGAAASPGAQAPELSPWWDVGCLPQPGAVGEHWVLGLGGHPRVPAGTTQPCVWVD